MKFRKVFCEIFTSSMIGDIIFTNPIDPNNGFRLKAIGSNINITLANVEIFDVVDTGFKFRCPKNISGEIKLGPRSKVLLSLVRRNITTLHLLPGVVENGKFWVVLATAKRLERAKFEEDFIDQDYSGDQW